MFKQNLTFLNFTERIQATDGRHICIEDWHQAGKLRQSALPFDRDRQITKGELGCYDSHVNAWQSIVSNDRCEIALVLEDDAKIDWSVHSETLHKLRSDPKIVQHLNQIDPTRTSIRRLT